MYMKKDAIPSQKLLSERWRCRFEVGWYVRKRTLSLVEARMQQRSSVVEGKILKAAGGLRIKAAGRERVEVKMWW